MKAIRAHRPGEPEVLQIEEIPRPEPRAGWVRIRVRAFGLNRVDLRGHASPRFAVAGAGTGPELTTHHASVLHTKTLTSAERGQVQICL
jgi:hypothetical protein